MTPLTGRLPIRALLLMLAILLVATGCGKRRPGVPPPGLANVEVPEALQPRYKQLVDEGERNWVLNMDELAVEAMRVGDRDLAERSLSEAMLNISNVFGSTPEAAKARSLFYSEDSKLFKGESYERAMTFLYRGILYMQAGDYESARACFRSGVLQDTFAEEEQNQADWSIFDYLIAVCEQEMRRPGYADEAWQRAAQNYAGFPKRYGAVTGDRRGLPEALPALNPNTNLLVICQQGRGPQKVRGGARGQYVGYKRPMNQPGPSIVRVGDKELSSWLIDSVFFQATTRGGRPFDAIQKRKVIFKDSTEAVGNLGLLTGVFLLSSDNEQLQLLGLAILAGAAIVRVVSELTKTGADIRHWQSLPDSLSVYTASHPAGEVKLQVFDGSGTSSAIVPLAAPGAGLTVILSFPGTERALLVPPQPTMR